MLRSFFLHDLDDGKMNPQMFERALSELSDETRVPVSRLRELYVTEPGKLADDLVKICDPKESRFNKFLCVAGGIAAMGLMTAAPLAIGGMLTYAAASTMAAGAIGGAALLPFGLAGLYGGARGVQKSGEILDLLKYIWNKETGKSVMDRIVKAANMKPDLAATASLPSLNARRKIVEGLTAQAKNCTGDLAKEANHTCNILRTLADVPASGRDRVDRDITELFNRAHQRLMELAEGNAKNLGEMDLSTARKLQAAFHFMAEEATYQIERIWRNNVQQAKVSAPIPEPAAA